MHSETVTRAVGILLDDHYRQGYLCLDDVIRVIEKRGLTEEEALALQTALEHNGIGILASTDRSSALETTSAPSSQFADLLAVYLQDISAHSLLRADEEVLLGRRMRIGERAKMALAQISPFDYPALTQIIIQEGDDARDRMIVSNLRLVINIAKRYASRSRLV